jgi:dihydroneopterin aldolase
MENSVYLEDLEFFSKHGLYESERDCVQKFLISVRIFGDFTAAMKSDSIAETIDYSAAYATVKRTVEENRFHLVERLASEISANIFREFTMVTGAEITIKKYPLSWTNKNYGSVGFAAKFTR